MAEPKRPSTTTVLLYAAVAVCLLFVLASLRRLPSEGRPHRRLKLRTDFPRDPTRFAVRFDPIVAEIEMRREDRAWESTHYALPPLGGGEEEWEGYGDAEDYINDEGRFNVEGRIEELFPKIDVDPKDGRVTLGELKAWFVEQATRDREHRTKRGMELHDKNKDGFVSFGEYQEQRSHHFPDSSSSDVYSGWFTPDHFHASDMDGDGRLDLSEFTDFFHPADSKSPKLIGWLCKEEIRHRDKDKDGKLNFEEFYPGLVEFLSGFDPNITHHSENSIKEPGRELFARLDLNNDRYLDEKELEPVIGTFHPSELSFADQQAEHSFKQADSNKDGHLTLKEMMDHPYAFYAAVETDEVSDLPHEEFR